jgi:coatomer subunit beta'
MARTYLPSEVSNIVALWRDDLKKVIYLTLSPLQHLENRGDEFLMSVLYYLQINQTAAESLADPQEYPNLFPDWQSALETEAKLKESR